ncbi:response regulator [Geobacter sp. DSM 9736]|uniref:response regulator n=1 Tax=Geobacter sp. DSM 9736 TaxID=1277350 RepID=UPI000B4FFDCA|nr:response regulator [Geobacter sp. DSM 9736]SNB46567.1 Response regulator receiver domain-containing protein [Geobacter sp. DSM 9736]
MKREMGGKLNILLVEDNPGDVELVREALADSTVRSELHVAADGVLAMQYLRREGEFSQSQRPDLILLDLNLPRKSGIDVLREMKSDPDLQFIPVIVLTSSKSDDDILRSYSLHANCYVTKPVDFDQFMSVVKSIEEFWLAVVKLPYRH